MSRIHAVSLAVALISTAVYAQTPAGGGQTGADDEIRRLLLRLAPVPLTHSQPISSMAFSRDGKTVTTVSAEAGKAFVWDSATGRLRGEWRLPHVIARSAVGGDGKLLALADGAGGVSLWDVSGGKRLRVLQGTAGPCVAVSPDSKSVVAGLFDGRLGVWDAATGKLRCPLPKSAWSFALNLAFSPDGKKVAAARPDGTIGVWHTAAGNALHSLPARTTDPALLSFTPNGNALASSDRSGLVRVWDLATARERRSMQMPPGHTLTCGQFTPDGRALLTGGADGTVRLWEMASGKERHRFPGQGDSIHIAALASDGRTVAIATGDKVALVREVAARAPSDGHLVPPPRPKDLEAAWADLAQPDAAKAYRAIAAIADGRAEAVSFMTKRLQAAAATKPEEIARLIRDLDSPTFATRSKAMKELERLHEGAEEALEAVLQRASPLEVRRRAEQLLDRVKRQSAPPERLQALRAVEALEAIGTPEARQVLQTLANGAAENPLTEHARAALDRLRKGPTP